MSFDEQPDGDPHGQCAAEIHRLQAIVDGCLCELRRLRVIVADVDVDSIDRVLEDAG